MLITDNFIMSILVEPPKGGIKAKENTKTFSLQAARIPEDTPAPRTPSVVSIPAAVPGLELNFK